MNNNSTILTFFMSFKRTIGVIGLAAILLAIPLTLTLNQRSQTLQQQAAEITPPAAQPRLDVNQDGMVDSLDTNAVLRCITDPTACTIQNMQDLNGDEVINADDYRVLIELYAGPTP